MSCGWSVIEENGIGAVSASIDSHGMSGATMVVSIAVGAWTERERRERPEPDRDPARLRRDERAEVVADELTCRLTGREK
jgi:hypothetical protein